MTDHEARLSPDVLLSRRAMLAAAIGGVALVTGCTGRHAAPVADPDAGALQAARDAERMLLETYAADTEGHAIHLAHLRALGDTLQTPSPGNVASGGGVPLERGSVQVLMEAARNARRGTTAALLASIAASHAVLSGVQVP